MVCNRVVAAAVASAILVSGCTGADRPSTATTTEATTTAPTTTEPPTTTTSVALPPPVPIQWRGCGGGLDCGTVTVPVDYVHPDGGTIDLALVRHPASDPARRIGTVLANPGGPGASGVRRVARGFRVSPEVGRRFDVVGFDPRGVGGSASITCGATVAAFRHADLTPDTPAEETTLRDTAKAVADECIRTEGPRLTHLGTLDVARDVEVIRRAIGEPTISFVGLSYGTEIGLVWADLYPTSVRALVLDGVVNPAATGAVSSESAVEGVAASVGRMAAACDAAPACPLAPTGGFDASYDGLARHLEDGTLSAHDVGPTQLAYAAFYATYDSDTWPRLWQGIADGLRGDLAGVDALATSYTRLVPYSTFALLTCMDGPHALGYDAWEAEAHRFEDRSPRFAVTLANELLPCAFWPQSTYTPHAVTARGSAPILAIGTTGDTATSYDDAKAVVDELDNGVLLTVDLNGHIAIGDSDCATEAATRYLVDLSVPASGTRC
jgi:pimeloyl-ACP methyl ester carboxylesterase